MQIRRYDVIYKITDDLKLALEGMLKARGTRSRVGPRAWCSRCSASAALASVAGCRVLAGVVERNARARVIRDSTVIGDYSLDTLRREKDDAKEVREGFECGIKLAGFNDVKEGDLFEIYKVEESRPVVRRVASPFATSSRSYLQPPLVPCRPAEFSKPPKPSARSSAWRSSPTCAILASST